METIPTNPQANKYFVDWREYGALLSALAEKIKETGRTFSGVYGLPRGGLPVAIYLSHNLKIPMVMSKKLLEPSTLVVDDLVDTGRQLRRYTDYFTAALYSKPWTTTHCNISVETTRAWIVFPYEQMK